MEMWEKGGAARGTVIDTVKGAGGGGFREAKSLCLPFHLITGYDSLWRNIEILKITLITLI